MNCEQARELLPAYLLGALDPDETRTVEAHLKAGHEHDEELVELRATVFALNRFADERALEPERHTERAPMTLRPETRARGTGLRGWLTFTPAWRTTAIAASLAIAIFVAGWFASGLGGDGAGRDVSVAVRGSGGQSVSLSGVTSEQRVTVSMSGFERLDAGRVYELWAIRDGTWTRIGVCNPHEDGAWSGEFPFAIRPGEHIALTIEPAGGSDAPTSPPVLLAAT
jgi:anti-sigma-K factor RskA